MDCNGKRIDLHIHSTASDGSLSPEEIVTKAYDLGLAAISITDHDTADAVLRLTSFDFPPGLEFISGIEISAAFPPPFNVNGSIHILGYGFDPENTCLDRFLALQKAERKRRIPAIIKKLNDSGIPITATGVSRFCNKDEISRPDIARFLVMKGHAASMDDAFARFLNPGAPGYVDKYRAPARKAIETIHLAGGISVLAHPGIIEKEEGIPAIDLIKRLIPLGLDGIEAYYSGHSEDETELYLGLSKSLGLIPTGGSDFHGSATPEIEMGSGGSGLGIPYSILSGIKNALRKYGGNRG